MEEGIRFKILLLILGDRRWSTTRRHIGLDIGVTLYCDCDVTTFLPCARIFLRHESCHDSLFWWNKFKHATTINGGIFMASTMAVCGKTASFLVTVSAWTAVTIFTGSSHSHIETSSDFLVHRTSCLEQSFFKYNVGPTLAHCLNSA